MQAIPEVNPLIRHVRTRHVVCPLCQIAGHYQKSCPRRIQADGDYIGVTVIAPPITRANKQKRQKIAVQSNMRRIHVRDTNYSGESDNECEDDINPLEMVLHTNVFGLPIDSTDLFASAVTGETEADVLDWDSVFNENPNWARSLIYSEERETRGSFQQLNIPAFRGNRPGPKDIPFDCKSPLAYWKLFMSNDIIDQFVTSTNSYATSTGMRSWHNINSSDLFVFIAAITYLGIVKVPNRRSAWTQHGIFSQPYLKLLLTAKRFEDILSALHWTNTANNTKYARSIGMHCNGTIKTNRKGINQELLSAI